MNLRFIRLIDAGETSVSLVESLLKDESLLKYVFAFLRLHIFNFIWFDFCRWLRGFGKLYMLPESLEIDS